MTSETGPAPKQPSPKVVALIVTFHPEPATLRRLVSLLTADGISIIVADNGGGRAALESDAVRDLEILDLGSNLGIGAAINRGIDAAKRAMASHVITFDQDSQPAPGMVLALLDAFVRQERGGTKIGAVGPRFIDSRPGVQLVHPFVRLGPLGRGHRYCDSDRALVVVDTLITSGCLTSMRVLELVGRMNQEYFVDYTDMEWCFRAKAAGFVLLGVCAANMKHELGHGASESKFGINLFSYSPARRYYYARNTLAVAALSYVPLRWKLRLLAGLLVRCLTISWAPRDQKETLAMEWRMLLRGLLDGLRGVRGPLHDR